jgi:site-specific recombinase XerD
MKRVPKPKLPQEQIRPLTPEELACLLQQPDRKTFIGLRDAAFTALLANTGLRISEAIHSDARGAPREPVTEAQRASAARAGTTAGP